MAQNGQTVGWSEERTPTKRDDKFKLVGAPSSPATCSLYYQQIDKAINFLFLYDGNWHF